MFLTVGEKIRNCRRIYQLKQIAFSKFGISQHYLSMIESQKRQPTIDMINQIYDAFDSLTHGEIRTLYDKESFRQTPSEQARVFLRSCCGNGFIHEHYEELVEIAKQYDVSEALYDLNMLMGQYYQELLQYEISNNYFMMATHEAIKRGGNLSDAYRELAFNAKQTLNYKIALSYYVLAEQYTEDKTSLVYYQGERHIAFIYIKMNQFESAMEIINRVIQEGRFPQIIANMYMLKFYAYYKQEQWEIAKSVMDQFIEQNIYEPYRVNAYHNLAEGYYRLKQYEEAMTYVEQAIKLRENSDKLFLSQFVKGKIHHELKNYEEAKKYYGQSKDFMLSHFDYENIQEWYCFNIKLFHELGEYDQVFVLLAEIKKRSLTGMISEGFLNEIKLKLMEWKCKPMTDDEKQAYYLAILKF